MLDSINHIKGVGLLHDADGRRFRLKKASFIYADNVRGKSTLASILRSCSIGNPSLVTNRVTINVTNSPEIQLHFSDGQRPLFQNGSWTESRPELLVFDADFVEQNVYSGGQVSPGQRRNLLQFALGTRAVVAQTEYGEVNQIVRQDSARVRDISSRLSSHHSGMTFDSYERLSVVPDADQQITNLNGRILGAQNIGQIQAKALPNLLTLPSFDIEPLFRILITSLTNIDQDAEARVRAHLDSHHIPNLSR